LRFVFPTQEAAPGSGWRPALYPIPWALTPGDHFYFARPVAADKPNWPLADYRYGGVFFADVVHSGVDIQVKVGTPVLAAGPGEVTWAGYGIYAGVYDVNDPYGLAVYIRHDFGYEGYTLYTLYAHLDRVDVVKGQRLETGDRLGLSGQTGKVTGPHLHFEVRLEKDDIFSTRNPELWLAPPQGWGVLAGEVMNSGGRRLEGQLVTVVSKESGQKWWANTYSEEGLVRSDAYYQENLVVSDLPAGRYEIVINLQGKSHSMELEIRPGLVSTFTFRGYSGFTSELPVLPGADFTPPAP
jgi:murein DD-endopeptidase MepM/ murein hydrolase activator NlpD